MNKQELIKKIKKISDISDKEKSYLIDLVNTKKKYGLVWENKTEDVEEQLRSMLPVFKEVKERAIISEDKTAPNHILIEGDNLHALTALTYTHEEKIDVIYIDPPYNTGSKDDFMYNDRYVDKEDAFRHSKWLSFMDRRLRIAKELLKEDGVIYCSIGDDEVAQLTLLFNEIFTEKNRLGIICRISKPADAQGNYFSSGKDYVLSYAKNIAQLGNFKGEINEDLFKKIETDGARKGERYRDDVAFYQASLGSRPSLRYYIECPDGSYVIPPGNVFPDEVFDGAQVLPVTEADKCWRWSKDTYLLKKDLIVFKKSKQSPLLNENGSKASWNIYTKSYLTERSEKGMPPKDYLDNFINRKGADLIKQYDLDFSYSKPFELIDYLIKITNKPKDITVLDFFAGSGTTLHSTLYLNQIDDGSRTCILVTNNENGIAENVTYSRANRLIVPYTNRKGKVMTTYPKNSLRYFQADFIPSARTEVNRRQLTARSTELLCIKENCYHCITADFGINPKHAQLFADLLGRYMVVVYHSRSMEAVVEKLTEVIQGLETTEKVKIYAFSPEKDSIEDDFFSVQDKIETVPLPDSIYNAYRATFRTLKLSQNQAAASTQTQDN